MRQAGAHDRVARAPHAADYLAVQSLLQEAGYEEYIVGYFSRDHGAPVRRRELLLRLRRRLFRIRRRAPLRPSDDVRSRPELLRATAIRRCAPISKRRRGWWPARSRPCPTSSISIPISRPSRRARACGSIAGKISSVSTFSALSRTDRRCGAGSRTKRRGARFVTTQRGIALTPDLGEFHALAALSDRLEEKPWHRTSHAANWSRPWRRSGSSFARRRDDQRPRQLSRAGRALAHGHRDRGRGRAR